MSSHLDFEGVYDKSARYIVYNWSPEDFTQHFGENSAYNGDRVITVDPARSITIKAGEMKELSQFEAYTITKHFVNREISREASLIADKEERSRAEMKVGNKEARKPYEEKTLSEVHAGQESPIMAELRASIRKEEVAKLADSKVVDENISNADEVSAVADSKPKKQMGRPKKVNSEFAE